MSAEHSDIDIRAVFGFGAGLVVVTAGVYLVGWLLFGYLSSHTSTEAPRYPLAAGQDSRLPPEPRLQTDPKQDLRELRTRQEAQLKSYQWIDQTAGIARIPIDEAMRLTIAKGLPTRGATELRK